MNWVKKSFLSIGIGLLMPFLAIGQSELRKAEKYIDLQHYGSAIAILNTYPGLNEDQSALVLLGKAYNGANQLKTAKSYFEQASQLDALPAKASLAYGKTLMALEEYEGALQQFSLYGAEFPDHSMRLIAQCGYAIEHKNDPSQFKVSQEYLNTSRRDFSPVYFEEDIVYLSDREDMGNDQNLRGSSIELLKSSKDSKGVLKFPKRVKSLTGQAFDIVNVAYNPTLGVVAVTKGQAGYLNSTTSDKCTLYIGNFTKHGAIKDLKPYEFNMTDYSTGMVAFSVDGMTMYFASDREGGYGGYDLYESKLMNGQWSSPINLGSNVNTPGNEVTPYVIGDLLLFASDSREGFGGYDIYKAYNNASGYGSVTNLGTGINSAADDHSMTYNPVTNDGYFVSTRATGKGLEDIYRYKSNIPLLDEAQTVAIAPSNIEIKSDVTSEYEILKGMAIDNLGNPIDQVDIQASADDQNTIITAKSNEKGLFTIPLEEGLYYTLSFESKGYQKASRTIKMERTRSMPLLKVEMIFDQVVASNEEAPIAQQVSMGDKTAPIPRPLPEVKAQPEKVTIVEAPRKEFTLSTPIKEKVNASIESPKTDVSSTNAYKAPETTQAFAIQIAALSNTNEIDQFSKLKDLGTLYTLFDDKVYRVRCGLFSNRSEAEAILRRIHARGFDNSFIVAEKPNDNQHLVMMDFGGSIPSQQSAITGSSQAAVSAATTASTYAGRTLISPYKVRLATYTDPKWFDGTKVEGSEFGYIEILLKEGKSIYLLAGFDSIDAAMRARNLAKARGFKDAVVVKDVNGQLKKI